MSQVFHSGIPRYAAIHRRLEGLRFPWWLSGTKELKKHCTYCHTTHYLIGIVLGIILGPRDVALANSSLEFERTVLLVRFIVEDLMKVLTEQGFPLYHHRGTRHRA